MHKTQVFVAPEGDHFRTRLTHTIEVSRVARSLATELNLNADLADAVALAHDLGHPPFGHAGEEALAEMMKVFGGFEHNAQAVRIVTSLERPYISHDGLNLTSETLEGIAKHNGPVIGEVPFALAEFNELHDLRLDLRGVAEAQVAASADDVAYICHDLQDGISSGMLTVEAIRSLPLTGTILQRLEKEHAGVETGRIVQAMLRKLFKRLARDIIVSSQRNIDRLAPRNFDDIRRHGANVIGFSNEIRKDLDSIRVYLGQHMYRCGSVEIERQRGQEIVRSLFNHFMADDDLLPGFWKLQAANAASVSAKARVFADFIAGMTDNFAINMHERIGSRN